MSEADQTAPALELRGIDLHYGFAKALDGIDVQVDAGEIVALLGDNGAGKSTLLKVMSGAHRPSGGSIRVHGRSVQFSAPSDATGAGIQMAYQDLALVEAFDISFNLSLGREVLRRGPLGWLGFLDHRAMRAQAEAELAQLGVSAAPMNRPVEMLSGGQRQVVALARAAVRVMSDTEGAAGGVLLLDEPTAALGHEQTRQVRDLVRRLAARGIAVVVVTHDLPLCFDVAHRIVVLNRGRKVADVATAQTSRDEVVGWITGSRGPQPALAREVG